MRLLNSVQLGLQYKDRVHNAGQGSILSLKISKKERSPAATFLGLTQEISVLTM